MPFNPITANIKHDMRFAISMPRKEPYTYKISKVDDTSPKGIIMFTLKQTEFNQFTDYVNLDTQEMIADYYATKSDKDKDTDVSQESGKESDSKDETTTLPTIDKSIRLDYGNNDTIMISGSKTITAITQNDEKVLWKLFIDDEEYGENGHAAIESFIVDDMKATIKMTRTRRFNGHTMTVYAESVNDSSIHDSVELKIVI